MTTAAEVLIPKVAVRLDRDRSLKYDFNALIRLEKTTGKNILSGEIWQDIGLEDLRALLWAGLLHEDPDLTMEQAGAWIGAANFGYLLGRVMEAWGASQPEPKEGEAERPPQGPRPN